MYIVCRAVIRLKRSMKNNLNFTRRKLRTEALELAGTVVSNITTVENTYRRNINNSSHNDDIIDCDQSVTFGWSRRSA